VLDKLKQKKTLTRGPAVQWKREMKSSSQPLKEEKGR
jgi:hypothetical protein